jgi:Putative bacterial sensory transduction regulator
MDETRETRARSLLMNRRIVILFLVAVTLGAGASAAQQQGVTTATLQGYLDNMNLRYVPHPKNPDALVVPRSENKNAERLDLYVEVRKDQSLVLTVYPKLRGRYFTLARTTDREKMFQRLLEANHRAFATFFVDPQGDIGARFTLTTETGVAYEAFRVAVTELLRIADEYTPVLDEYMIKEERKPQTVPDKEHRL